ncbi:hypothetical protein H5410_056998 [Solanum commersonii]|uniref:Uncharacterized protein n=1 Tax=Solanum commersonii TaxID=4109 RepID=A0A9J5WPC1_SOLCO|nr:hypothetical protein H5410_056998 [Solanum commersonii]
MTVERNILYDDFMDLVIHSCGLTCQSKDLVISYIPSFFKMRSNHDDEIGRDKVSNLGSNNPPTPIIGSNNPASSKSSHVSNIRD